MSTVTVIIDDIYSDHATTTSNSLIELAPDSNSHYLAHLDNFMNDDYLTLTSHLAGVADVVNWSFGADDRSDTEYVYDNVVRDAYMEGTAITAAAGNSNLDSVRETQRSPFDFTVGAVETFNFNPKKMIDGRATKDATWDIAWFSNKNPQFVDFYTYGDGGTSYAAPRVAAWISHIRDKNPDASLSSIRTVLEKNSDYNELETANGSWFVQILDPYDLENNTVRDGKTGYRSKLFSEAAPESEYTFDFSLDDTIDTRVRTEALYEVYLNRNPDPEGLEWWVNEIETHNYDFNDVAEWFEYVGENEMDNGGDDFEYEHGVPLIEKVQGLYHAHLGRESTDAEVVEVIDYISETGIAWNDAVDLWKDMVLTDDTLYI